MAAFKELRFNYKGMWASLAGSYIFHLIIIVVLFHFYTQSSRFVVPHVVNGNIDAHGTHLYWLQGNRGSEFLRKQLATSDRIVPKGKGNILRFDRNLPRKNSNKRVASIAGFPAGDASLNGEDIRPAIPIATLDPAITSDDLGGLKGDVIVEVTIDGDGNMVAKKIEHSLGQVVDQKVLAAVEGWRFRPAMKDGQPISSKQDIHYHFPSNDADTTKPRRALPNATVAQSPCPILLVSGAADQTHISITFINVGKLAVRQLEFSCGPRNSTIGNVTDLSPCYENNALFYPGQEYTLEYANQHARSPNLLISVKSVTLSDGYVWKPSRSQSCRMVAINVDVSG
jgi:TonB family protein